jgi:hypothetical protein
MGPLVWQQFALVSVAQQYWPARQDGATLIASVLLTAWLPELLALGLQLSTGHCQSN